MLRLEIEPEVLDLQEYKKRSAVEADYERLIDEECCVFSPEGELLIAYLLPMDTSGRMELARKACDSIKFPQVCYRTGSMQSHSRVFGNQPRKVTRQDYCSSTVLARESPGQHTAIVRLGGLVAEEYAKVNPARYATHMEMTEENVTPDFRLEDLPYTSGIINHNNPLKYHFDSGNYTGVWSGMTVFRNGMGGGFLSCPEFGLGFACRDTSLLFFDGQSILHGVTPFNKNSPEARRYSIVFYSLKQMWNCLPVDDEIARIKQKRTEREDKRLRGVDPLNGGS